MKNKYSKRNMILPFLQREDPGTPSFNICSCMVFMYSSMLTHTPHAENLPQTILKKQIYNITRHYVGCRLNAELC